MAVGATLAVRQPAGRLGACPYHPTIATTLACPRCGRLFWEHQERVKRLNTKGA